MIARLRTLASQSPLRSGDVLEIHIGDYDEDSPPCVKAITTLDDFIRSWAYSAPELQSAELDTTTAFVGVVHPDGACLYSIEVGHA